MLLQWKADSFSLIRTKNRCCNEYLRFLARNISIVLQDFTKKRKKNEILFPKWSQKIFQSNYNSIENDFPGIPLLCSQVVCSRLKRTRIFQLFYNIIMLLHICFASEWCAKRWCISASNLIEQSMKARLHFSRLNIKRFQFVHSNKKHYRLSCLKVRGKIVPKENFIIFYLTVREKKNRAAP